MRRPRDGPRRKPLQAPGVTRSTLTCNPIAPSLACRNQFVYNWRPHVPPPLGASGAPGPLPPAMPPCQPGVSPHPSVARTPPRPRRTMSATAHGHPPAHPPSHAAVNPVGAHPRRWHADAASPASCPQNSRSRPENPPKTVSRQPAPIGGRAGERQFPLYPPRPGPASRGGWREGRRRYQTVKPPSTIRSWPVT